MMIIMMMMTILYENYNYLIQLQMTISKDYNYVNSSSSGLKIRYTNRR